MNINFPKFNFNNSFSPKTSRANVQNPISFGAKFNIGAPNKDTVSFSGLYDYYDDKKYPYTDENTQVSMHHDLNGWNSDIRYALSRLDRGLELSKEDAWPLRRLDKIDAEFENLPPLEDDFVFYRGRAKNILIDRFNKDFELIENANEGDIIVPDKAYAYGAFKKELAEHWANGIEDNMMYEIHVPKGAKVSRNKEHGGEVVFPRGAKYRLISKEKDRFGTINVVLEYILPEKLSEK